MREVLDDVGRLLTLDNQYFPNWYPPLCLSLLNETFMYSLRDLCARGYPMRVVPNPKTEEIRVRSRAYTVVQCGKAKR